MNQTFSVTLAQEMSKSYLDYAMSVIVGRALPDCRDGLKPVHRRILYAMHELGNTPNKPYKKSARIIGDVLGKYHPHGDASVYDAIVRMAQPFSMGYTLVDGQGNFGSVDGDMAASMRYTEIRLTQFAQTLLTDLEKDTVDFSPNYDGNEFIPDVLPAQSPNFLINGSSGIAVGMATQTPPHHLREVMSAFLHYMDHPECTVLELMEHMPGPDLPTGACILGTQGIKQAYETGKGRFVIRAISHAEEIDGKQAIVFTEIPYQVNKAKLIEKIADLARDKKIEGIHALRDESDKDGMRIVIELKRDANDSLLMNHLYQQTALQTSFSINMVGICNERPELLTLRKIFASFLQHRLEIVTRRTRFEFDKAKARAHTLEGLSVALANIQPILDLIQGASSSKEAKEQLCERRWPSSLLQDFGSDLRESLILPQHLPYGFSEAGYQLSVKQAEAILEMRLHKLTSLEQNELRADFEKMMSEIIALKMLLDSSDQRFLCVKQECTTLRDNDRTPRKTRIEAQDSSEIDDEDLIPREQFVITLSSAGYIKTLPLALFEEQRRGGKGKSAGKLKAEDSLQHVLVAHSHDTLLCFSTNGKVYSLRVFELPSGVRYPSGKPIVNCIALSEGEKISSMLSVSQDTGYVFMTTHLGVVKKVELRSIKHTRSNGIIAIALDEGDLLEHVFVTSGDHHIMLLSDSGKSIRFPENQVRPTGRSSRGIRGMMLAPGQGIVNALAIAENNHQSMLLTASEQGYGKCTLIDEYRVQARGGMGVIALNTSKRNGALIGGICVESGDQAIFLTRNGRTLRTSLDHISVQSRNTQGVRLVKLNDHDHLKKLERIDKDLVFLQSDEPLEEIESEPEAE